MLYSIILMLLFTSLLPAQKPDGGGEYKLSQSECINETQRIDIEKSIAKNKTILFSKGILKTPDNTSTVSLQWPLKQADGYDYCSYYGISNFVDHNANFPNQVLDYNCGNRTYDLSNGYNHSGTDIFLWPFGWNMKKIGQIEVVAVAPGIIVDKSDGNFDENCFFNNLTWNAIYIEQEDGSTAWYGHMKKNSLTKKAIGASVAVGEKLGLVASSGSSTGPHLHFELHDGAGNILDPYSGDCSPEASWWATDRPYYEPTVNAALTHSAPPMFPNCPMPEIMNIKDTFVANDEITVCMYLHDQLPNKTAKLTINQPDKSIFQTWNYNDNLTYAASYWYWTYKIPNNPQFGVWAFSVSYEGTSCSHEFVVRDPKATSSVDINKDSFMLIPNPANNQVQVQGVKEEVEIYNIYGQLIERIQSPYILNTAKLCNGIYLVKSGYACQKLIVQH